jgi:hypothetical protein
MALLKFIGFTLLVTATVVAVSQELPASEFSVDMPYSCSR